MRCRRCMIWQRSAVNRRVAGSSPARGARIRPARHTFSTSAANSSRDDFCPIFGSRRSGLVGAFVFALCVCGCSGSPSASPTSTQEGLRFVAAPSLLPECRSTARAVGYPVPCPTLLPEGLTETGANGTPCALRIIGPGGDGSCSKSWRGWVVGSSETAEQHLVLTASPHPLRVDAKVDNGPAWYPRRACGFWHT
jgi:hypothetical protein